MIEPTETESKETMDEFIKILFEINEEIRLNPEKVLNAPESTPVSRIDEVQAARQLNLRYKPMNNSNVLNSSRKAPNRESAPGHLSNSQVTR